MCMSSRFFIGGISDFFLLPLVFYFFFVFKLMDLSDLSKVLFPLTDFFKTMVWQPPVSGLTSTTPAPVSIWQTPVSGRETRTRFRIITPPRVRRLRHFSTATPAILIILQVLRACTPALAPANTLFRFTILTEQLSDVAFSYILFRNNGL